MDGSDSGRPLLGKKFIAAKLHLVALVFNTQANFLWYPIPHGILSILQRVVSTLSITVTSAVIMVAGKRYVLFKFAGEGVHSQRVAIYSNPSIGNLAHHLVWHSFELPLLVLSAIWALGLATGLAVNDTWALVPAIQTLQAGTPFGPFDQPVAPGMLFLPASGQLSFVMASVCSRLENNAGIIKIMGDMQLTSGGPMGVLAYSVSTSLNGFNVSMETLSSVPSTAQNLTCVDNTGYGYSTGQLWYEGADNQTLSIIATGPPSQSVYRFNASAVILHGTLQSTGNGTSFTPTGSTQNIMSSDRWAQDIASLICNATFPVDGYCSGSGTSLVDFAISANAEPFSLSVFGSDSSMAARIYWSTVLGMAMGAYSAASWPNIGGTVSAVVTRNDLLVFTPRYGVYVLIINIGVSVLLLILVVRLRMASRLGSDFMNGTRLLLDPLKSPELFNASLSSTVDALANPYMRVREDNEFLLEGQPLLETTRRRTR